MARQRSTIEEDDVQIVVRTPYYDATFVERIKTIPKDERRWDAGENAWVVDIDHEEQVAEIIREVYGEDPEYV